MVWFFILVWVKKGISKDNSGFSKDNSVNSGSSVRTTRVATYVDWLDHRGRTPLMYVLKSADPWEAPVLFLGGLCVFQKM